MTGDTTVRVARKGKMFTFVESSGTSRLALHICESVFRKSFSENVEVFLGRRMIRTALTFV